MYSKVWERLTPEKANPSKGRAKVKRTFMPLCSLFLMLGMADDGCLGKAQFEVPHGQGTYSFTSSQDDSANIDIHVVWPLANLLPIPHRFPNLTALLEVDSSVILINFYFQISKQFRRTSAVDNSSLGSRFLFKVKGKERPDKPMSA
jgi:hypothetical protein